MCCVNTKIEMLRTHAPCKAELEEWGGGEGRGVISEVKVQKKQLSTKVPIQTLEKRGSTKKHINMSATPRREQM